MNHTLSFQFHFKHVAPLYALTLQNVSKFMSCKLLKNGGGAQNKLLPIKKLHPKLEPCYICPRIPLAG